MNFTREPIIETVITPREGCKLVVRSSKGSTQEDYFVDAVEVVSFGHSFFYRSLERPKSFLVPVSDYEILELRETRMVLKNVSSERSLKIGGGRDAPVRSHHRESQQEERPHQQPREESVEASSSSPGSEEQPAGERNERGRRDRRGRRGRRGRDRDPRDRQHLTQQTPQEATSVTEGPELSEEPVSGEETKAPSFISKLFPPPSTLIKETLGRYKTVDSVDEETFSSPSGDSETKSRHREEPSEDFPPVYDEDSEYRDKNSDEE